MKKLIAILMLAAMTVSMAACGAEPVEPAPTQKQEISQTVPATTEAQEVPETTQAPAADTEAVGGLGAEFKAAMDSYETFMNKYVDFMKKYQGNPTDPGLLTEYASIMSDYAEFVEDFEKWESEEMNAEEAAYYAEVNDRVAKKLAEIA